MSGRRTILFLDEIHRFNKAQQDALLPVVESGLITLIGATTENPYFEVNGALLSRCALYEFEPLPRAAWRRSCGAVPPTSGPPSTATSPTRSCGLRAATRAPRSRSWSWPAATARSRGAPIGTDEVEEAAGRRPVRYDKDGDVHYDAVSAFIKAMRGSDPDAALYWLAVMIAGGEDPKFIVRRMIVFASEDVGNADPRASSWPSPCAARSSSSVCPRRASTWPRASRTWRWPRSRTPPTPPSTQRSGPSARSEPSAAPHLRDGSYRGAAKLGRGVGYRYPHAEGGFVAEQRHLPDGLEDVRFYEPTGRGSRPVSPTCSPSFAASEPGRGSRLRAVSDERGAATTDVGQVGSTSRPRRLLESLEGRRERFRARGPVYRWLFVVVGILVVVAGAALLVLPGPGVVVIAIGLAMLALQFDWAERMLARAVDQASGPARRPPSPPPPSAPWWPS
jgi:putative ATPase